MATNVRKRKTFIPNSTSTYFTRNSYFLANVGGVLIWTPLSIPSNSLGAIGDSYGVLTSLVTALSVVAIWFSLYYQRKDTKTQIHKYTAKNAYSAAGRIKRI